MADDFDFGAGFVASDSLAHKALSQDDDPDRDVFDIEHRVGAFEGPPRPSEADLADRSAVWSADAPLFDADGPTAPASDLTSGADERSSSMLSGMSIDQHRLADGQVPEPSWGPDLADRSAVWSADAPLFAADGPSAPASDLTSGPDAGSSGMLDGLPMNAQRFGDGQLPEPTWGPDLADRSAVWSADAPLFDADGPTAPTYDLVSDPSDANELRFDMQTHLSDWERQNQIGHGLPSPTGLPGQTGDDDDGSGYVDIVDAPAGGGADWFDG